MLNAPFGRFQLTHLAKRPLPVMFRHITWFSSLMSGQRVLFSFFILPSRLQPGPAHCAATAQQSQSTLQQLPGSATCAVVLAWLVVFFTTVVPPVGCHCLLYHQPNKQNLTDRPISSFSWLFGVVTRAGRGRFARWVSDSNNPKSITRTRMTTTGRSIARTSLATRLPV